MLGGDLLEELSRTRDPLPRVVGKLDSAQVIRTVHEVLDGEGVTVQNQGTLELGRRGPKGANSASILSDKDCSLLWF